MSEGPDYEQERERSAAAYEIIMPLSRLWGQQAVMAAERDEAQFCLALCLTFGLPGEDQGKFLLSALQKSNDLLVTQRQIIAEERAGHEFYKEMAERARAERDAALGTVKDLERTLGYARAGRNQANSRAAVAQERLSAFKKVLREAISGSEEALHERFGHDA